MCKLIVPILIVIFLFGCDPGIHLRPSNLDKESIYVRSLDHGNIQLKIQDIGGLIGETWESFVLDVHNNSKKSLVLESAILEAGEVRFIGDVEKIGPVKLPRQTVESGKQGRLSSYWDFDKPLFQIYQGKIEIILTFIHGSEEIVLRIPFENIDS